MESFLMQALQLIVALALLVIIHEFGHFLFARIFGIKVEKFYMFFNPWFSLAKFKPKAAKKPRLDKNGNPKASWRDTEYGIGWIPLGGYVKIAGMVDESLDTDQLKSEPQQWEFRAKPAWQRLLVMLGGVLFNFLLAIIIYIGIAIHWGEKYIPLDQVTEGFDWIAAAHDAGLRDGDRPIAVDGEALEPTSQDFPLRIAEGKSVTVVRNYTDTVTIDLPSDFLFKANDAKGLLSYRLPVVADKVVGGGPAKAAGVIEGDRFMAIDSIATPSYGEFQATLQEYAGKPVTLTVKRGDKLLKLKATPTDEGKLGFQLRKLTDIYPTITLNYNVFQAVPKGISDGTEMLTTYVGSMSHIFSKEGAESIGGFGALGGLFPKRWNWYSFWQITAFLSVILAFMNFLPIPALDGGHILFLLWEIVTRRAPSEKFLVGAQYVGMAFLLMLLVWANANDIIRAFR